MYFIIFSEQKPQDIIPKKVPKAVISKKTLKFVIPKKSAIKPKKVCNKRGSRTNKKVGLSNSGNNCFMNAVWQALR